MKKLEVLQELLKGDPQTQSELLLLENGADRTVPDAGLPHTFNL